MNNPATWYKTFFSGLFLELWSTAIPEAYTTEEIKFIKEVSNIPAAGNILDVPCGYGRHSIAFAEQGYQVTGVDIAEPYVHELMETAKKKHLPLVAVQADILEYDLQGEFDLAVCLGNSFSYFSYEFMLQFARKISRVLKTRGTFIINSGALAESLLPNIKENEWMQLGEMLFLIKRVYHTDQSILQSDYSIISNGQKEESTAYQFIYTLAEIKRLLTEAGFSSIEAYSGFDKLPYKLGDRQVYLVVTK